MRKIRNPRPTSNTINRLSTNLIGSWRRQTLRSRRIIVIINPAAGQDRPILKAINLAMQSVDIDWNVVVTRQTGDGFRLARHAVAVGADTVAVYGGDGTVAEVASGLAGSKVVMGILPGGTSNWIAGSFGVPRDLNQALSLVVNPDHSIHSMRLGLINRTFFVQMIGIGLEAKLVDRAGRDRKERFGALAYGFSAFQSIARPEVAHYRMVLDHKVVETEGVTCMIVNADNLILPALSAMPPNPRNGLLDIFIPARADFRAIFSIVATMAGGGPELVSIPHFQARSVSITTDPVQLVQSDGEVIGHTPIKVRMASRTVRMIVSPEKAAGLTSYVHSLEEGEEGDVTEQIEYFSMDSPSVLDEIQNPGPDDSSRPSIDQSQISNGSTTSQPLVDSQSKPLSPENQTGGGNSSSNKGSEPEKPVHNSSESIS
jgi:diacylglycerol kinase (ATP)